jgi:hypothetical protein
MWNFQTTENIHFSHQEGKTKMLSAQKEKPPRRNPQHQNLNRAETTPKLHDEMLKPETAQEKRCQQRKPFATVAGKLRRNAFVQDAIHLRSAPSSPMIGEPSSSIGASFKAGTSDKRPLKAYPFGRRAGFSGESKNGENSLAENRREALCSTTDRFSNERIVARIVRKKF